MALSAFKHDERVKIIGDGKDSSKIYTIRKISRSHDGVILYILESEGESVSRLYYEIEDSALERLEKNKFVID